MVDPRNIESTVWVLVMFLGQYVVDLPPDPPDALQEKSPLRSHFAPLRRHFTPLRRHFAPLRRHFTPLRRQFAPLRKLPDASSRSSRRHPLRASPGHSPRSSRRDPLRASPGLPLGVVSAALRGHPPGFLRGLVASQVCGEIEDGLLTECVDHFPESCKFFTVFLRGQLAQFSSQLVCATSLPFLQE